ncbi:hypothetical protein ABL78_3331 [Leptomonas seymouri]|uniref:Sister chromatid cohesion protein DCC1 n=1 Tax=Leptomonas seymouri TaxID=5684 RepID=A0A0N1PC72_LEPSE|nr:hypothetical protein ABL78_3331 [Leptomonas seymouri]|eukprot:KPI87580.1 hypothetical protein ABL78_3331 [Leptomonas seymouri]
MNNIFIRSDFADRHEFRLLSIDDVWIKRFHEHSSAATSAAVERGWPCASPRKRARSADDTTVDPDADVSVVLIMKGEDQLCLYDETSTRSVRRVEYSNAMMLAKRRLNAEGAIAIQSSGADSSGASATTKPEEPLPLTRVREYNDDVVVASLSRMFDSHTANPQLNLVKVLSDSYLTIDELEEDEEEAEREKAMAAHRSSGRPSGYTFAELARRLYSSPAELAQLLQRIGALVHRGRVRLLHPSLVYEALEAVLTYFDAADPKEVSWQAARLHLCPSVYPDVVLRSLEAVYGASPASVDVANSEDVPLAGMVGLLNVPRVLAGLATGIFDTHAEVTRRSLSTGEVARGLPVEVFLEKWWDSIPSSLFGTAGVPSRNAAKAVELSLEILRGYAVVEPRLGAGGAASGTSNLLQGMLWWMPKDVLTNDFAARLRVLFELRPQRWNQQDLKAYMDVLLAPDQNFQHVMVRYAREYRIPGQAVQYAPLT